MNAPLGLACGCSKSDLPMKYQQWNQHLFKLAHCFPMPVDAAKDKLIKYLIFFSLLLLLLLLLVCNSTKVLLLLLLLLLRHPYGGADEMCN